MSVRACARVCVSRLRRGGVGGVGGAPSVNVSPRVSVRILIQICTWAGGGGGGGETE